VTGVGDGGDAFEAAGEAVRVCPEPFVHPANAVTPLANILNVTIATAHFFIRPMPPIYSWKTLSKINSTLTREFLPAILHAILLLFFASEPQS
jgi:hypothetical protein